MPQLPMLPRWLVPLPMLYIDLTVAFALSLIRSLIDDMPRALEDAAMVDACGGLGAVTR